MALKEEEEEEENFKKIAKVSPKQKDIADAKTKTKKILRECNFFL